MYNKKEDEFILRWAKKIKAIELMGGKCIKCGNNSIFKFEFHHIGHKEDKDKEINRLIGSGKRWSLVKRELDRCNLVCRNCHAEIHYLNGRSSKKKIEILQKLDFLKCQKCGYKGSNYRSLEFHHKNLSKSFCVSNALSRKEGVSVQDIMDEISKCDIICRNCHVLEHTDIERFEKNNVAIYKKVNGYVEYRKIDHNRIFEMKKNGMGVCAIAKQLGINKSTISHVFNKGSVPELVKGLVC
ncbi:unnamed protein product [marine sediment metagenome]|uniref:Uncharacterized protein n=1 Tax=marine sediment metagenome TaxID=412755 RepID=X0ZZD5_9ZZZZ